jgi:hypothetical protein
LKGVGPAATVRARQAGRESSGALVGAAEHFSPAGLAVKPEYSSAQVANEKKKPTHEREAAGLRSAHDKRGGRGGGGGGGG